VILKFLAMVMFMIIRQLVSNTVSTQFWTTGIIDTAFLPRYLENIILKYFSIRSGHYRSGRGIKTRY
jgi:hypothetical protein